MRMHETVCEDTNHALLDFCLESLFSDPLGKLTLESVLLEIYLLPINRPQLPRPIDERPETLRKDVRVKELTSEGPGGEPRRFVQRRQARVHVNGAWIGVDRIVEAHEPDRSAGEIIGQGTH